jgi:hypothetical protein
MKVLNARIRWNIGWANNPELEILVDKFPALEEFEFENKESLWFAEKDGAVSFFHHSGRDEDEGGYYGSLFKIKMKDGSFKVLRGPWSSRSSVMNRAGFTHSMEAIIFEDEESFKRGYTGFAGHITIKLAKKIFKKFLPQFYLVKVVDKDKWNKGEISYIPSASPTGVCKITEEKELKKDAHKV